MSERKTILSPCRQYRYTLWRDFPVQNWLTGAAMNSESYLMVIGLNPSTADETKDDPTIRRCVGFAKLWGFGALCMTNLFAWRDTKPENMMAVTWPVGAENDHYLLQSAEGAGMIMAAWGKHGSHNGRACDALRLLNGFQIKCLKKNKDGSPMHPLYVAADTIPITYP